MIQKPFGHIFLAKDVLVEFQVKLAMKIFHWITLSLEIEISEVEAALKNWNQIIMTTFQHLLSITVGYVFATTLHILFSLSFLLYNTVFDWSSTVTNLTSFTQFISNILDNQDRVDVVYTDFWKAFDRINYQILLKKIWKVGIW